MARAKYETHIKPRFNEIKKWVKLGASEKEIYTNLRISKSTFYEYMNKHSDFFDLIKKNRNTSVEEIKAAMLKRALGFQYEEKKVVIEEIKLADALEDILKSLNVNVKDFTKPKLIKTEITTKTALPSETAGLILLKHWDKNNDGKSKWTGDPATLELKKKELKLKENQIKNNNW